MKIATVAALVPFVALCATQLPAVGATMENLIQDVCEYNTYMCCWTENDGNGMEDNTDVCRVLDSPDVGETREYPGESEGESSTRQTSVLSSMPLPSFSVQQHM